MSWPTRPKATEPSGRQLELLDFIRYHVKTFGFPPTIRAICAGLNLSSTSTVAYHLDALERLKLITREAGNNRTLRLVTQHGPCPTCGHDPVSPITRLHDVS